MITAEALRGGAPRAVLRHVNQYLTRLEQTDLFVTVLSGVLDRPAGSFTFARAGHEIRLLANAAGKVTELPHDRGMPIGMFPDSVLDEQSVTLVTGDILLLYTDGMYDCRNHEGECFGVGRLRKALSKLAGREPQVVCDALVKSLLTHRGRADQDDDVTLVTIRLPG